MYTYSTANLINRRKKKCYYELRAFLLGLAAATLVFLPFIILDDGYFLYYGDFNVQQIPFYQMIHDAIRNGNFMWSFTTDLGANTIGSYSFYLMGSPFFWLTLPFSSEMVPHLMGPLLILKFACASTTGCIYLKRYVINRNYAVIGGLIYAFSGFSVYNIFFNHFHEAIIIFPLLLASLDELILSKKRGLFAFSVFLSCCFNYYFFVGQAIFCVIYWVIKVYYGSYRVTLKDLLHIFIEAVIGVCMAGILLVPSIMCIVQNNRLDNFPNGWGALLFDRPQRYIHVLQSLFFPPDIPAFPNFTPDSDAKWSSLGAWLPLCGMSGVLAFMYNKKKHWLKTLTIVLLVMAFVPVLNSIFQAFNMTYYTRWFYMLTLMMSLATILAIEHPRTKWKSPIKINVIVIFLIALPIAFMPKITGGKENRTYKFGLMENEDRFWVYVAIALVSLLLFALILSYRKKMKQNSFLNVVLCSVLVVSVAYSGFIIALGKSKCNQEETHKMIIPYSLNQGKDINLPDTTNCRIDVYNGMDNQGMFWQIPTIQAFHSIVPGSIMDFYPSVGVPRDVGSRPKTEFYGLRALLSCRWLFSYASNYSNLLPGFEYYDHQNGFDILENKYYIPFGFSYNKYITQEQYYKIQKENRHLALLKSIVLTPEGEERNKDILEHTENTDQFVYSTDEYYKDCTQLKSKSAISFSRDNSGFSAEYLAGDKDELVFFSVPYEDGFTAFVNGEQVQIEKTNIGFMSVRVPANRLSQIRFKYYTPGLNLGIIISICAFGCFAIYVLISKCIDKKNKTKIIYYRIKK